MRFRLLVLFSIFHKEVNKSMIKSKNKIIIKTICLVVLILIQNYVLITMLSSGQVSIDNFYCDAEIIGYKRYKADVNDEINFTCEIHDSFEYYAVMGDETPYYYFVAPTFSYNYSEEGIYTVTLWATGIPEGWISESFIIEIDNDAPEFDIGFSAVEYYKATYDFEADTIGEAPYDWTTYNDVNTFYPTDWSGVITGTTLQGSYLDLMVEDDICWVVETEVFYTGRNTFSIGIDLWHGYEDTFTPGYYKLYFAASDEFVVSTGQSQIRESYCYGEIVYLQYPEVDIDYVRFVDYPITVEIDWLKLEKLESEGVIISKDVNDHGKVVSLNYRNSTRYCGMMQNFAPQTFGTIELWYYTKDAFIETTFRLDEYHELIQKENCWFLNELNITSQFGFKPNEFEWYHIRIDWRDYNTPAYLDLDLSSYRFFINGHQSDNFTLGTIGSGVDSFAIESNSLALIDAIGYTWENYDIGDNLDSIYPDHVYNDEEITFSAINLVESERDKKGFAYNIDGEIDSNYSYVWDFGDGNYSNIKQPSHKFSHPGDYPIRLTLIDDQGAMTTMVRNLTIQNRIPISKITYGINFDASYDFKNDISGISPNDWHCSENVKVTDYKGKFSKVVEIDTREGAKGSMSLPEIMLRSDDQVEFWVYFSDVTKDDFFFWTEANTDFTYGSRETPFPSYAYDSIRFGVIDGTWQYLFKFEEGYEKEYYWVEIPELPDPQDNLWTHVRFLIDYKKDIFKIIVDGISSNPIESTLSDGFATTKLGFSANANSHVYLDSIGFSWDENYQIGDNNPVDFLSHYGTWDFRYYPNGEVPYDKNLDLSVLGPWIFSSNDFDQVAEGCLAQIVPEIDGHYKVLELQDNNNNDIIQASLVDLEKPTYGSIEFWIRTSDISQGLVMAFGYQGFRTGIWLGNDGTWWYQKDSLKYEITDVSQMESNVWKHIRIDFDCRKEANYLGLSHNQFNFWVDGKISQLGPFSFDDSASNFQWNIWSSEEQGNNYSIYLDAVGVSWDPAYEIGDNLNPREAIYSGSELIFYAEGHDTLSDNNNLRYFWNFGDNQTTFGETILHTYRKPGEYKIQLITMDNTGYYSIDEIYICIDNCYPNIKLAQFSSGYCTYDFYDDEVGTIPYGWYTSGWGSLFETTEVVERIDDFYKVVKIGEDGLSGGIWTSNCTGLPATHEPGDLNITYGTVEFWFYTNDTHDSFFVFNLFEKDYRDGVFVVYVNSTWRIYNQSGIIPFNFESSWQLQNNTWTHFRIDFCCDDSLYMGLGNDEFIVYGNDNPSPVLSMTHFSTLDLANITCFGLWTYGMLNASSVIYVDDIGFSWDPNYEIGNNKKVGETIQFNEGDTIILQCLSEDTYFDYLRLIYQWGYLYNDVDEFIDFGWHFPYIFMNNVDGDITGDYSIIAMASDPYLAWDATAYDMRINNVPPSYSIFNAQVSTNISATIHHSDDYAANFTISIVADNETYDYHNILFPADYSEDEIFYNLTLYNMGLSKSWEIFVNQTGREGGEHVLTLYFQYTNGYTISKSKTFDGAITIWSFSLNDFWVNNETNLPEVPIMFNSYICDPSTDMIDLSIDYVIEVTYEVSYPSTSLSKSFVINNEVICDLRVKTEGSKRYAIFKFTKEIENFWEEFLFSKNFPVSYYIDFTADMTDINLFNEINAIFNSIINLNQIGYIKTYHYINSEYIDGEYSSTQSNSIGFQINSIFEFYNLAPNIYFNLPYNLTEDKTFEYIAEISDYDQDNLTVSFRFGINSGSGQLERTPIYLGNNTFGLNHTYTEAGTYIFTVLATDGVTESIVIQSIEILNQAPYAKIRTFVNATYEDETIKFEADITDTESDTASLRFYWDFGDGTISPRNPAIHSYCKSGDYLVRLFVKDDNGELFIANYNITILDKPPEIKGPFSFTGIEGQTTVLDIEITDSISDSIMEYTWDIYEAYKIYNATYNFLNINEGELPGFPFSGFISEENLTYQIIDEIGGHVKVLQMDDSNKLLSGYWVLKYGNAGTMSGSIEFWLRASYLSSEDPNFEISLFENETGIVPLYISGNGTWIIKNQYLGNDTQLDNLPQFVPNHWHHVRIDYECSDSNYLGLGENEWRLVVDGVSSSNLSLQFGLPPNDSVSYLDTLKISSSITENVIIYCDAIGYSNLSTHYQVNDNLYQQIYSHNYVKTITGLKPALALDEGSYLINLRAENDAYSESKITLEVKNLAPIISVPNKRYYGDYGYIEMTTYCRDSIMDVETLEYEWTINNQKTIIKDGTLSSTLNIECVSSGNIKGYVIVRDASDLIGFQEFNIRVFIDSNGDGLTNELEILRGYDIPDQDGDNLPNAYEELITYTNGSIWDTDYDGLCDGWDNKTLAGEYNIGTDPLDPDTDNDTLLDGFEYYGWNVTYIEDGQIIVKNYTSSPFLSDTDGDGLSDKDEYTNRTNPRSPYTDNDGLTDFEEVVIYGSNPLNPDTDGDGLIDSIEVVERTYFDNPDSDGDGILDGIEYLEGTNPLCKDTDHDYLPDNEEIIRHHYEIDGRMNVKGEIVTTEIEWVFTKKYPFHIEKKEIINVEETRPEVYFPIRGITSAIKAQISFVLTYGEECSNDTLADFKLQIENDINERIIFEKDYSMNRTERYVSEVIDIKDVIENAESEYFGTYIMNVNFKNELHSELCCEEFFIDVFTPLNSTLNDYDNDGIIDGVESNLLVHGDSFSYYDDVVNLTSDTNSTTYDRYQFEISDVGLINDAEVWFNIISNGTLNGNGNVTIKLMKRAFAYRTPDILVLNSTKTFSTGTYLSEFYNKNLFSIFSNVSRFHPIYGKYEILIDIYDSSSSDGFMLTNLTINIGGYRQARFNDTDAWITKPELADTDGDGWSDKYEIYDRQEPTNPLAWDTDGDGVKDSKDWEPLYNIVLEVRFIEGALSHISYERAKSLQSWHSNAQPKLQMVVLFGFKGEDGAYVSTPVKCTHDTKYAEKQWHSSVPYKSKADFDNLYYIDVEDDEELYLLQFELWDWMNNEPNFRGENRLLPSFYSGGLFGLSCFINFREYERDKEYLIENWQDRPKLKASVTTRSIQHANTIAIYRNESLFNGHYNEIDRYHVIQVNVIDTPSSKSHFISGVNIIVIPNKAFMASGLSSLMQNASALENSFLADGHFITIDRTNLPAKASNTVETMFNVILSSSEAEYLLDLVIMGIINDTSGEIGIINSFVSTKQNNTKVEMMNLPHDVLYVIPYITPFNVKGECADRMPAQGRSTTKSYGIILDLIIELVSIIFDGDPRAINMVIEIIEIAKFVLSVIVEAIIAFGAWIAEQAAKAALLILIYRSHAIKLGIILAIIGAMYPIFLVLTVFCKIDVRYEFSSITVEGDIEFYLGFDVGGKYNSYLETDIPTIESSMVSDYFSFEIISYFFGTDIDVKDFPIDFWGHTSSGETLDQILAILSSMALTMKLCGGGFSVISVALAKTTTTDGGASFSTAILVWLGSLLASIGAGMAVSPEYAAEAQIGIGVALMISGIVALATEKFLSDKNINEVWNYQEKLEQYMKVFDRLDLLINVIGPSIPFTAIFDDLNSDDQGALLLRTGFDIFSSLVALLIGAGSFQVIPDPGDREMAAYIFGFLNIAVSFGFFISAAKLNE